MTGLDISKDHLIEIAVLITDGDLNIVEKVNTFIIQKCNELYIKCGFQGPELVINQPKEVMDNMNGKFSPLTVSK